jgi:hypothetical protein
MLRADASRKRCAIYTRKFSEEGLSPTRSTNGLTRARIVSPRGSTIRSPRGEGSAATGRIAAFAPPIRRQGVTPGG